MKPSTLSRVIKITMASGILLGYPLLMHHFLHSGQYQSLAIFYLLQFLVTQFLLALVFALTLLPGKTPLITRFAQMAHGLPLPHGVESYGKYTTLTWALFFLFLALTSCLLYIFGSLQIWLFFCNFLYLPLIAAMFIIEYLARSYFLPHVEKVSILMGWNLYWKSRKS